MINPDRVEEVLKDCLFDEGESTENMVRVEGVVNDFGFNPNKLIVHFAEIEGWLLELSDDFMESKGGGYSMLSGCMDRQGEQWTGFQMRVGQLFCLGIGIGKGRWLLPKPLWSTLPGGLPYYVVLA